MMGIIPEIAGVVELLNSIFSELDVLGDLLHVYKVGGLQEGSLTSQSHLRVVVMLGCSATIALWGTSHNVPP
eukprot:1754735-Amphidinium_carterae.1